MGRFLFGAILLSHFLLASHLAAQDSWIGKKVMPKIGAQYRLGANEYTGSVDLPITVRQEKTGWLWSGKTWIKKEHSVLMSNATGYYTQYLRKNPKSLMAYNNRGSAWRAQGELDNAVKDHTEAIRLNPKIASSYTFRGNAWSDKGDLDNAIKDYTQAIRIDPNNADAYYNRGANWIDKGKPDYAIEDFTQVIRIDPKNAYAYYNRANNWIAKGEPEKAIKDYSLAIRIDPNNAHAANNLAWILATSPNDKNRDGKRAVELATQACQLLDWKVAESLGTLAAAHAETGNFQEAVNWQNKAIQMDQENESRAKILEFFQQKKPYRDGE